MNEENENLVQCKCCLRWVQMSRNDIYVALKLYDEIKNQEKLDYICEDCLKNDESEGF